MLEILWKLKPYLPVRVYQFFFDLLVNRFWKVMSIEEFLPIDELRRSERGMLLDSIFNGTPARNFLEIGTGHGQNFWLLRRMFLKTPLTGVERDPQAVEESKQVAKKVNLENLEFICADASQQLPFPDCSFDLTFISAALLYVSAEDIQSVINEVFRVTSKRIIIMEQHVEDDLFSNQDLGVWKSRSDTGLGYWVRDYRKLLSKQSRIAALKYQKVPQPRYPGESWQEAAYLFEVELEQK